MRTIIFIFFLLVVSFVILMPPQLQLGKTTLYRPQIDFSLGASRIFRDLNFIPDESFSMILFLHLVGMWQNRWCLTI